MSFFTSLTGLNAATAQLGVTSNNISNASTVGFKRSRADFGDIFATSPLQKATSAVGQGVSLKRVTQEFGQGNMNFSSNTLDLAISGDGFFPLKSGDGFQDIFTRNGSFMMNDQYNVVNSAGQRLMAASVDSTGKANLSDMNVLTIPQKTTGMAKETSLVQLGLNFPADAQVVTKAFNRNDPDTYNKSTALTVYDKGGNGYLATVYYAKTQNASQADPNNKWQTYVYVGETLVAAALQQATDATTGEKMYVNKYGQLKPESEVSDLLVNSKTQKFSLNQLTDKRASEPATVTGGLAPNLSTLEGIDFRNLQSTQLTNLFSLDVDGTGLPVQVGLEHLAGSNMTLSGTEIAKELTNVINRKFGDERYFNFAGQQNFAISSTNAEGTLTENRMVQLDATDMTYEEVVNKINDQLNGSSNILSNVAFSSTPLASEFKGYSFTLGSGTNAFTVSGEITLSDPLSTKPMEDLVSNMQENIQQDLVTRFGYSTDAASKVTVNVQNGNEIRLTSGDGITVSSLTLSTVSTGSPVSISNSFNSGTIATGPVGTYALLDMQIGSNTITDLDISTMDSTTLEAFAKELKTNIQTELTSQGWSSFEAGKVDVKVNDAENGFTITDGSGNQITQFTIARSPTDSAPITGTAAGSSLALDNVAFSETRFSNENRLNHFKDFTVNLTTPAGLKLTKTIPMSDILAADAATATPKLTNFDPTDTENGPAQLTALAGYMDAAINIVTGWTNLSGTPVNGVYPLASRAVGDTLTLAWESDTSSFTIATGASSGTFVSSMSLSLNTSDLSFGSLITKGGAISIVAPELDSGGAVTAGGSLTLSNVSFPQSVEAVGDEFESFSFTLNGRDYPTAGVISLDTLNLSSSPMTDLALALQAKIRSTLKTSDGSLWDDTRTSKINVSVINGKDLKITDAGGAEITGFELNAKASAAATVSTGAKSYSIAKLGNQVTASYDPVSQKFNFTPPLGSGTIVALSGINNQLGITSPITQDAGSDALSTEGAPAITNNYIRALKMQRYGMKVEYDTVNEKFIFKSGSTGDDSSIKLTDPSTYASEHFGLLADGKYEVKTSPTAVRGIASQAAVMQGSPLGINANNNFSVNLTNNKFVVSVDDVKGTVYLEPKDTYTIDSFVLALQNGINRLAGPADQNGLTGPMVSGVKVAYDSTSNRLKFTSGTASTNSFIKVSGDSQWGLANVEGGRGATSSWIKPTQYTQVVNGVAVAQYIDEFGNETFSPDGFKSLPEWSPIFLEKGELTFDTGGNLVSPKQGSQLDTVYLPDGKGALTININYSKSTQFSSPYAVLSQSQDGAPEGDLVGLSMGDDGLVNASYSNGSQKSLGKVVLVNFTNPTGLRQIGDTSYYKSASSGTPKYGEAGSAGFGTVRSGATERANVDLTQELVDLITAQRNFQANAKAIETSTTLTQSIIQIRA
jgi:flagellar hook-basal body protein